MATKDNKDKQLRELSEEELQNVTGGISDLEKTHVNIGTIGHVDHGKTTLTAAISVLLARNALSEVKSVDQIDVEP